MAMHRVNARDIIIEARTDSGSGGETPTWVEIGGLTSATVNRSENEETAETTNFASRGVFEQDIMQRGATLEMEGQLLQDPETGDLDPGQAAVTANAGPEMVGALSHAVYRFRYPSDTEWTVWDATTSVGESGGGNNDKASFNATLTRSGPSTSEAVA